MYLLTLINGTTHLIRSVYGYSDDTHYIVVILEDGRELKVNKYNWISIEKLKDA